MSHDYAHSHGADDIPDRLLLWTVIVNLGLSAFEFAAGAIAGSVALMADALHNTKDIEHSTLEMEMSGFDCVGCQSAGR